MESLSIKETLYVCEVQGSDTDGMGSEKMPYKTVQKAINHLKGALGDSQILVRKSILDPYTIVAKAALKKAIKTFGEQQRKAAKDAERKILEKANWEKQQAAEKIKLDAAKSVVLELDPELPEAQITKLNNAASYRGSRIKVSGWVHRHRVQGKDMMFIVLRDGYGYLQCVLTGKQCHTYDALTLTLESTVSVYGQLLECPEGKTVFYIKIDD
ncbi:hypothetical protein BC833DRAFT_567703 [Globomyces pollinis-pini]|nr:hypothetical protein BC833DRAFT_567703 [Globomyces pollinis-pini]